MPTSFVKRLPPELLLSCTTLLWWLLICMLHGTGSWNMALDAWCCCCPCHCTVCADAFSARISPLALLEGYCLLVQLCIVSFDMIYPILNLVFYPRMRRQKLLLSSRRSTTLIVWRKRWSCLLHPPCMNSSPTILEAIWMSSSQKNWG